MAATVSSTPASPASCYRPLQYVVVRTDPAGTLLEEIFIADASDVSTLGSGLVVGDVVVKYTGSIFGGIPVVAGQTIILDSDCGPYEGVQMVTLQFDDSGDHYAVIDAVDAGDFTPASAFVGSFKVWLSNYTIHLKILVYTDPEGTPQEVLLKALPGANTSVTFNVDTRIRDYFNHDISAFAKAVPGATLAQDAHGVTALFYRVHIAEVYDVPGETALVDPYDGDHDILEDDTEDLATMKVAVNAIHPFAGPLIDWTDTDFSDFIVGGTDFERKFLTNAPRGTIGVQTGVKLNMATTDRFRLHMLTDAAEDHEVAYTLRVYNGDGASLTFISAIAATIASTTTSAVSFGVGPADLSPYITLPGRYVLFVSDVSETSYSEPIEVIVDSKCKEVRRPFAWLNKLGGIDAFTFTGREFSTSKVKRAVVKKPYGTGTGFDFRQRTYRSEPERSRTVASAPVNRDVSKWLGEDLGESANVVTTENSIVCPVVVTTSDIAAHTTGPFHKPVTIDYMMGVDNMSQQA